MKVSYITGKDGKPLDIRALAGDKLKHHNVAQGSCSDGKYIYIAFEQKKKKNRPHRCKIVKFDPEKKRIVKVSGELKVGHGNDMTYRGGILYVTHSAGSRKIHRVDASTLHQKKGIKVTIPKGIKKKLKKGQKLEFNGIAKDGDGFLLRMMGGSRMLVTDKSFKAKSTFKVNKSYKTSQGMDQKGGTIYRAYSNLQSKDQNYLVEFNSLGKQTERHRLDVTGELEGVFIRGTHLYGTIYRKHGKGSDRYKAFIFKIL